MADQAITPTTLTPNTASAAVAATALTAANDGLITAKSDNMIIFLYDAGGAGGNAVIKSTSAGILANQGDITVELGAGEYKAIQIDSARVKALSGTDKGKIRIDCDVNVSAWAFELT